MSQKAEKPSLSGQRLKTRKRDEKEKYDPTQFRDAVIQGLNDSGADLDQVSKFLDASGSKLDYRRYADVLFDILFAGGQLAPGGSIVEDPDTSKVSRTDVCVFTCGENIDDLRAFYEVFYKLIRRYKYLERTFEDVLSKIFLFLKGFTVEERRRLAIITGLIMSSGLCSAKPLSRLFDEHLVKEGLALEFTSLMFKTWLQEKDVNSLFTTLKKAQLEGRLLELLPLNKRSPQAFCKYFEEKGLGAIVEVQKSQQNSEVKKHLKTQLRDMMSEEQPVKDVIIFVKEQMQKHGLEDQEVVGLAWHGMMSAVEWNKKEDLVAEQALRHIRMYTALLSALAKSGKSELLLILKVQEYCYENINFMKVFQKIIVLFYKTEVLSEETITKWYSTSHSAKGKSMFLDQMKSFIEWLNSAEEESEEEEDE